MRRQYIDFEEIAKLLPLIKAAQRSAKASAKHAQTQRFLAELEWRCGELSEALIQGTYRPKSFHSFMIRDPKPRWISAAPFTDRVVHHSLCAALEPRFERYAYEHSYACRKGKGTHLAIQEVQAATRQGQYSLKLDIKHYFETIPHLQLKEMVRRLVKGKETLNLCDLLIDNVPERHQKGYGLPIGNLTSQHFANLYLGQLDHYISHLRGTTVTLGQITYFRYMDDLVFIANQKEDLRLIEDLVKTKLETLGLTLKQSARRLTPITEGLAFLGCRIWPQLIRFDGARRRRMHRKLKQVYSSKLDDDSLQQRLSALHSWANHCGARHLMYTWHNQRQIGL